MAKKIERTNKRAEEVVAKISPIFDMVNILNEEDIDYLQDTARIIEQENSKRQAVAGILIPLEKAEAKNALGDQAIERITGLILIWSALKKHPEIMRAYYEKARKAKEIEEIFDI